MIGKMSVFNQKWQKAKKRHGTYSKNYFICWDQNPKIENFEKKIEISITQKMDLIRNLKKWSKISSKHFLSRNYQFSAKMVLFDSYEWTLSIVFGQKRPILMKIDGARPRKRLLSYVYDMNLVRNVQKCSKMRSLKLKRKRGDWKSLKKVRKKRFRLARHLLWSSRISFVFWFLIGLKFFCCSRDRRQSPPSGGNTNRVANRLQEFQIKW